MAFILSGNRKTAAMTASAFSRYRAYLDSVASRFPPSALNIATSNWYFSNSPKSPHDCWLESVELKEEGCGVRLEQRRVSIQIRLLASYHDGFIEFSYPRVFSYKLSVSNPNRAISVVGNGDWLFDEFRLSESDRLIHEIEWERALWRIESDDVHYRWIPK